MFGNYSHLSAPFVIDDQGSDDVITLTFKSTVNTANNQLSATASNQLVFSFGPFIVGAWKIGLQTTGGGTVGTQTINSANAYGTVNFGTHTATGIVFTSLNGAASATLVLNSISANALNCFTAGTQIATAQGNALVEDIVAGDVIKTADGKMATVKWVGVQNVNTRLTDPKKVNPIRICAGALGNGLPLRDLELSQDHTIAIDGVLINAGALVNGTTIYQIAQMPTDGFTYYHIETEAHELLLAEGVAAETFIDYAGRDSFENGDEASGSVAEMALPRISSARMVPSELQTRLNENKQSRSMA
ncbi:hypothetical protein RB2150_02189 [Rhodobacteraceae bacterium HTCC2150]|nr:hypothetical protein RB2150_02189 [Rhodobacteraceae bacterium HTCC2150]